MHIQVTMNKYFGVDSGCWKLMSSLEIKQSKSPANTMIYTTNKITYKHNDTGVNVGG